MIRVGVDDHQIRANRVRAWVRWLIRKTPCVQAQAEAGLGQRVFPDRVVAHSEDDGAVVGDVGVVDVVARQADGPGVRVLYAAGLA